MCYGDIWDKAGEQLKSKFAEFIEICGDLGLKVNFEKTVSFFRRIGFHLDVVVDNIPITEVKEIKYLAVES